MCNISFDNRIILYLILFSIIIGSCINKYYIINEFHSNKKLYAKVIDIVDGDTISVLFLPEINNNYYFTNSFNNTNYIRFLFIDTIETHDNPRLERFLKRIKRKGIYEKKDTIINLGKDAYNKLKEILPINSIVLLEFPLEKQLDDYGRYLALVSYNNTNINLFLVYNGYAMTYFPEYDKNNINFYKNIFKNAENEAKLTKKGIWNYLE